MRAGTIGKDTPGYVGVVYLDGKEVWRSGLMVQHDAQRVALDRVRMWTDDDGVSPAPVKDRRR